MNHNNKHYIIILPTLMDDAPIFRVVTKFWHLFGFTPIVLKFGWRYIKNESDFIKNIDKIIVEIERLSKDGKVSLIGCSAGGSVAINVFSQRTNIIHRVIDVCGALRLGNTPSRFDTQAYLDSLKYCEKSVLKINEQDKKRIMTIRPQFGDEFVKKETVIINGAKNITIPTYEHIFSIFMTLTFFSKKIFKFLKED